MTTEWQIRLGETALVDPRTLKANPANWRLHPKEQTGPLQQLLAQVGWVQRILVNKRTGLVVDGHARIELAIETNQAVVPVNYVDLDRDEEELVLALYDPISAHAETNPQKLAELLTRLAPQTGALGDMLTQMKQDVAALLNAEPEGEEEEEEDFDPTPDETGPTIVQPGDIWALGQHKLICGDSTDPRTWKRLMGDHKAAVCFTDPPWNVAIGKDSNPRHRQRAGLENDDLSPEEFAGFLRGWITNLRQYLEGDLYCVLGASEWPTLDRELRGEGYHWSATIIWVKDIFVLGRSKYHRRYEPIWYGWHETGRSSYTGARDQDDVWEIPRPKRSEEHPTMKPVPLVEKALLNSSLPGDLVVEPFCGSGTTLIAAVNNYRRCYAMEISPHYCDVILNRYEKETGDKPELLERNGD